MCSSYRGEFTLGPWELRVKAFIKARLLVCELLALHTVGYLLMLTDSFINVDLYSVIGHCQV